MSAPAVSVTPASPDVNANASGVSNRRLSYQPGAGGAHQRVGSSSTYNYGSSPYAQSHLRTGSVPYVPDAPNVKSVCNSLPVWPRLVLAASPLVRVIFDLRKLAWQQPFKHQTLLETCILLCGRLLILGWLLLLQKQHRRLDGTGSQSNEQG